MMSGAKPNPKTPGTFIPNAPHITHTDDDKNPHRLVTTWVLIYDYKRSAQSLARATFTALRRDVSNIVVFLAVRFR